MNSPALETLQRMLSAIMMGNEPRHWDTDKTRKMIEDAIAQETAD